MIQIPVTSDAYIENLLTNNYISITELLDIVT